ncbi:hypothetical protein [Flaviaesturariibacter aridisoli]|uniref:Uncharacterized protein n=1 Tax=Flaviaesturariibacter aridisoli TaxID=2545761 RepID=A0A4R4DTD0_9BACT|nr:hypothetical protein [Flaviaesturariibacter aridisoli]TCZ65181.1 hypothetical protein E0486_17680 [Flaviaesturariibacter aridisoli]
MGTAKEARLVGELKTIVSQLYLNIEMDYSIEEIYLMSGQFDKVVNVTFKHDSESQNLYGEHITGEFIYTPKERAELQRLVGAADVPSTDGYVKFHEILKYLPEEKRQLLRRTGIKASDIQQIIQRNTPGVNHFASTETRSLPKPIEIKVDFSDVDEDAMTISTYNMMLSSGFKLTPDEADQLHAAMLKQHGDSLHPEKYHDLFIDKETGKVKESIRFHVLERKYYSNQGLTEEENKEFMEIWDRRLEKRMEQASKELERATENVKDLYKNNPKVLRIIPILVSRFREERLAHSRFPVWWDFERFLHIYLRHVNETQVGERFEQKTPFQYQLNEVKDLIKNVLDKLEKEIDAHFMANPNKDFKRQGSMSVYHDGDYYTLHIAPDGRLMTFYKSTNNGEVDN